ncbi:hypothetical protein [Gaiella sp.]|uniref:hypothetical protein n=1 Tax=Gaiella sp. TaxID=2663207 RepID=UPI0032664CAE
MKRVIYRSQAEIDFSPGELVALLEFSRRRNTESALTGPETEHPLFEADPIASGGVAQTLLTLYPKDCSR